MGERRPGRVTAGVGGVAPYEGRSDEAEFGRNLEPNVSVTGEREAEEAGASDDDERRNPRMFVKRPRRGLPQR